MSKHEAVVETLAGLLADEEEELAHALHDDIHPSLAAIRMSLEAVRHGASEQSALATVDASLSAIEGWARAQHARVRASLLKRMSLGDALFWYVGRLEEERGASISVSDDVLPLAHPLPIAIALLGHVQELLQHHVQGRGNQTSIHLTVDDAHWCVSTTIAAAQDGVRETRFERLIRAMGGVFEEARRAGVLFTMVRIPRS